MLPVLDFLNLDKPIFPQPRKVIRGYDDGDKVIEEAGVRILFQSNNYSITQPSVLRCDVQPWTNDKNSADF